MPELTATTSFTLERLFPYPPARLWVAFTEPEWIERWLWGPGAVPLHTHVDLRRGGGYAFSITPADAGDWPGGCWEMLGHYVTVEPGRRLVFTMHWNAPVGYNSGEEGFQRLRDEIAYVDFASEEDGAACRVTLTHAGIPDDGVSAPEHERSVAVTWDLLAEVLEEGDAAR